MDGFVQVENGKWYYFPSQAHAKGVRGKWIPWDQAPDAWRQATIAAGQRGKSNVSTQTGPVPTGRDPFNPAPGTSTGPLGKVNSGATTSALPQTKGTAGGFLDDSGPKKLGREVLGWLGKDGNWKDVLGAAAGAYGLYNQRQRQNKADSAADAGLAFAQQDWESRAPLRERFMSLAGGAPNQKPDLSAAFADPSNPFYSAPPPRAMTATPSTGMGALPPTWSPNQEPGMPRKMTVQEILDLIRRR